MTFAYRDAYDGLSGDYLDKTVACHNSGILNEESNSFDHVGYPCDAQHSEAEALTSIRGLAISSSSFSSLG
jgi:hypothetical protein